MAKPEPLSFTVWHRTVRVAKFDREAAADDSKLFVRLMVEVLKSERWDAGRWGEFEMEVRDRDRRKMATIRVSEADDR